MPELNLGSVVGPPGPKGDPGTQGPSGGPIPTGGAIGQIIEKTGTADNDVAWRDNPALELATTKQDKLTGQPGQVVGFSSDGSAAAVQGWSNPNILINADFRQPVNRNGKTEYTEAGYTIDRWRMSTNGGIMRLTQGIHAVLTKADTFLNITQPVEDFESCKGKTLTASCMGSGNFKIIVYAGDAGYIASVDHTGPESVASVSFKVPQATTKLGVILQSVDTNGQDYAAAKLELGSQQTLAHQDASGNWVLNDPPDYDLQYALCSLYSPTTGEWIGSQHSNPNLLDNWYFVDPINQRGQTEYTGLPSNSYCIDRWASLSSAGLKINYVPGTGLLSNGDGANYVGLSQRIERFEALSGQTVTVSALLRGATSKGYVQLWGKDEENGTTKSFINNNYPANSGTFLVTGTVTLPELYALQVPIQTTGSVTLIAAKLELGSQQTLAHQDASGNWALNDPPPNKTLELAKCQRYLIMGKTNGFCMYMSPHIISFCFPVGTRMRANPTLIGNARVIIGADNDIDGFTIGRLEARDGNVLCVLNKTSHGLSAADAPVAFLGLTDGFSAEL